MADRPRERARRAARPGAREPALLQGARTAFSASRGQRRGARIDGRYGRRRTGPAHDPGRLADAARRGTESRGDRMGDAARVEVRSKRTRSARGAEGPREGLSPSTGRIRGSSSETTIRAPQAARTREGRGLVKAGDWKRLDEAVRPFPGRDDEPAPRAFPVVASGRDGAGGGAEMTLKRRPAGDAGCTRPREAASAADGRRQKELLLRYAGDCPRTRRRPVRGSEESLHVIALAKTRGSGSRARNSAHARRRRDLTETRILSRREASVARSRRATAARQRKITALAARVGTSSTRCGRCARPAASEHGARSGARSRSCSAAATGAAHGPSRTCHLEREGLLRLLGARETQERIGHRLKTGSAAELGSRCRLSALQL